MFVLGHRYYTNAGTGDQPVIALARYGDRVHFVFEDDLTPAGFIHICPEDILILGPDFTAIGDCVYLCA